MTPGELADIDAQVERLFHAGETDEDIKRGTGLTMDQIKVIRSMLGLKRDNSMNLHRTDAFDRDFLLREWNERCATAQKRGDLETVSRQIKVIAVMTGLHSDSVRRIYRDDLKVLPRQTAGRYTPEQWKRAKSMLASKIPYPEVARELGIDANYLRHKLPGYGLKGRDLADYRAAKKLEVEVGL